MRTLRPLLLLFCALLLLLAGSPGRADQISYVLNCHKANVPSNTVDNYNGIGNGNTSWGTTSADYRAVFGGVGTYHLLKWRVILVGSNPGAMGSGCSYTLTIQKNGVDTPASVTLFETQTTATWTGDLTFTQGDTVGLHCTPANTPANLFDPTNGCMMDSYEWSGDGQPALWSSTSNHSESGSLPDWYNVLLTSLTIGTGTNTTLTVAGAACTPIPASGVIDNTYVDLETAPGVGETVTVTLQKLVGASLVDQSVQIVISGTNTQGSDTSHSYTATAGDVLVWHVHCSSGCPTTRTRQGFRFRPNDGASSIMVMSSGGGLTANFFMWAAGGGITTEAGRTGSAFPCALTAVYFWVGPTNGYLANGQTLALQSRHNGANGNLLTPTVTGTGAAIKSGSATGGGDALLDGDTVSMYFQIPTGNQVFIGWGVALTVPQPPATSGKVRRVPEHPKAGSRSPSLSQAILDYINQHVLVENEEDKRRCCVP